MNRPAEQRGHPQVQSDVAQARDVLKDHVQKLENQKEPLSDAQNKELTDAKTTLSRLPAEKPASNPESARRPESANRPLAAAPEGAIRPHGELDADTPNAAVDLNRAPHTDPDAEAPRSRGDSDEQTHPAETQPDSSRPTRTLPGDAALPHRYDCDTHSPIQQKQSRRSLTGTFLPQSGTKQHPRDKRH